MKNILKNKKMMIAFAVLLVAVVAAFLVVRKRRNKEEDDTSDNPTGMNGIVSSLIANQATFPLRPYSVAGQYSPSAGSMGNQITDLQRLCNNKYGENLDVDGKYGPKTEAAFKKHFKMEVITESQYNDILNQ